MLAVNYQVFNSIIICLNQCSNANLYLSTPILLISSRRNLVLANKRFNENFRYATNCMKSDINFFRWHLIQNYVHRHFYKVKYGGLCTVTKYAIVKANLVRKHENFSSFELLLIGLTNKNRYSSVSRVPVLYLHILYAYIYVCL